MPKIVWSEKPRDRDFAAATSYLSLLFGPAQVKKLVGKLKRAPAAEFKAKDIFRASQLSLLGVSNKHVKRYQKKIRTNDTLSPILLVRDPLHGRTSIADGYHRLCAIYSIDEDAWIKTRIV